jgi:hypothetical protein
LKRTNLPGWVKCKNGISLHGISVYHFGQMFWEGLRAVTLLMGVGNFGTITSGSESDAPHSKGSQHYKYLAIDIRIRDLSVSNGHRPFTQKWWGCVIVWATALAVEFPDYVFVLEKTHLHVQIGHDNIVGVATYQAIPNLYVSKWI